MTDTHLLDDVDTTTPIGSCLAAWHRLFQGDPDALADVLADDAVLHSPVLFAPIQGKELVSLYLTGAAMTFVRAEETSAATETSAAAEASAGGDAGADGEGGTAASDDEWDGGFRYVRILTGEREAVLEFETTMEGKYVNGVDIITCDDDGLIVEFKVMVRPLKAVEAVRAMMAAALDQLRA